MNANIEGHGSINSFTLLSASYVVLVAVPGILINLACIVMLQILPGFKNSFGSLCTSRCVSNMTFMLIYVGCGGGLGFAQPRYLNYFLDARAGQFLLLAFHSTMAAHIIIAINRLMALFLPMLVQKVFNTTWLYVIIAAQWLYGIICVLPLSFDNYGCTFAYVPSDQAFEFLPSACSTVFNMVDFTIEAIECALLLLLNVIAFIALAVRNRQLDQVADERQKERSRRRNMRFFIQEVMHDVAFLVSFFSYAFIFPSFMKQQFLSFVFASAFWILSFAIDSLILIAFNAEMRECLRKFFCRYETSKVAVLVKSNIVTSRMVSSSH